MPLAKCWAKSLKITIFLARMIFKYYTYLSKYFPNSINNTWILLLCIRYIFWINRPFGLILTFFPNSIIHSQIILNFLNLTTVVTKVKRIQKLCILVKATGVHVVYYIGYIFFLPKINFETKSYKCILFCKSTRLFHAINRPAISLKKSAFEDYKAFCI